MQKKFRIRNLFLYSLVTFSFLLFFNFDYAYSQDYPAKPINMVLPYGPGGQVDLMTRALMPFIPEHFGQSFVVHHRPGGAGAIGSNEVAQAKPDGYTLLFGHVNTNCILPAVEKRGKGPDDLVAVARIGQVYSAFWVLADAPWKNIKEVIAWAKANPGKLVYGNIGTWSSSDLSWRWLEKKAGFTSRNVPSTGGGALTIALLGGHVQLARLGSPQSYPHWKAGKIRPLVIGGPQRLPDMPDVPSLVEEGYDMKGLGSTWQGFFAPKGTPRPIIDKFAESVEKISKDKRAIAAFKVMGIDFAYLGPDDFDKAWREEFIAYRELAATLK